MDNKDLLLPPSSEELNEFTSSPSESELAEFNKIQGQKEVPYSEVASGAMGLAKGGTLGFADELAGLVRGGIAKVGGEEGSLPELYRKYRDLTREEFKKAEEANPKMFGTGEFGGGAASMLVPGLNVLKGIKGASVAAKAFNPSTIKGATALSAAAGLGGSTAELASTDRFEPEKAAIDTGIGGGLGLAGGYIGQKLGRFFSTQGKIEGKLQGLLSEADQKLGKIPEQDIRNSVGSAADKVRDAFKKKAERYSNYPEERAGEIMMELEKPVVQYTREIEQAGNNLQALNKIKRAITDYVSNDLDPKAYDQFAPDFSKQKLSGVLKEMAGVLKDHIEKLGDLAGPGLGSTIKDTNLQLKYLIERGKVLKEPKGLGATDILHPKIAALKVAKEIAGSDVVRNRVEQAAGLGEKIKLGTGLEYGTKAVGQKAAGDVPSDGDVYKTSSEMYNADDSTLGEFANRLSQDPDFQKISKSLSDAIAAGDRDKKNAALFAIAQKHKARKIFKGEQ